MVGALYGLLVGAAFALMSACIDVLLHLDLPLGVDWSVFVHRMRVIALGLALIGAVTCWWKETWQGLLAGAAVSAALALIVALVSSDTVGAGAKLLVLVFTLMPVTVMAFPVAWILRRITEHHAAALQLKWSNARIAGLILLAVVLGAAGGYFMKMPPRGLEAVRFVHGLLEDPAQEKDPILQAPGMQEHLNSAYKLYQKHSESSTEGYDIRIRYEDGYVLKCVIVLYPGRPPYISICEPEPVR